MCTVRGEQHKDRMASVIHHFTKQMKESGKVRLFEGSGGYANGEQRRDFVYVRDLVRLNLYFAQVGEYAVADPADGKIYHAIVNAGSGQSRTFNEVASALMQVPWQGAGGVLSVSSRSRRTLSALYRGRSGGVTADWVVT